MPFLNIDSSLIVRVAKDSSGHQALSVKRVGGATVGLCDSPQSHLQSLGVSQELRLASSDFLEIALDRPQLLLGLTCELAEPVTVSADSLHIEAGPNIHLY
jgi:hypothetical protein